MNFKYFGFARNWRFKGLLTLRERSSEMAWKWKVYIICSNHDHFSLMKWHHFTVNLQSVWTRLKCAQLRTCYAILIHEFLLLFPICFIQFLSNLTNWHILNGSSSERVLTGKRWKHDWLLWMKNQSQPANHQSPSSCLRYTNTKDKWHSSLVIFAVAICLMFFFLLDKRHLWSAHLNFETKKELLNAV